jgi:hypothetical protein
MAALCVLGMGVGLLFDAAAGRLATFLGLCSTGPASLLHSMRLHWTLLPAMHLGMLLASSCPVLLGMRPGFGQATLRALARNAFCFVLMLAGMSAGALLARGLGPAAMQAPLMIAAMLIGMLAALGAGSASAALASD